MPPAVHPGWIYRCIRRQTSSKPNGNRTIKSLLDQTRAISQQQIKCATHPQLLTAMRLDTRVKGYVSMLAKNWKKRAEEDQGQTAACRCYIALLTSDRLTPVAA